jgi:uncharacterized protein YjdB
VIFTPSNASNKKIDEWKSDDEDVATVVNGVVTAHKLGTAQIKAVSNDGKREAFCTVSVVPVRVKGITLNVETVNLELDSYTTLLGMVVPTNATETGIKWESSAPATVSVDNGVVNALKTGPATITATTVDGDFQAKCVVTVVERPPNQIAVEGIALDKITMTLGIAGSGVSETSGSLTATIEPSTAYNKAIQWRSSNAAVATVNGSGGSATVSALTAGSAIIIATTDDGGKVALCNVTVQGPPVTPPEGVTPVTGITLSTYTLTFNALNATAMLTATISPRLATNDAIAWMSSSPGVVTVEKMGSDDSTAMVSAKAYGTAVIIATTEDGGKTAICVITVQAPPDETVAVTGVTLDKSTSISLIIGGTDTFVATVAPPNATYPDIVWASSVPSVASVDQNGNVEALSAGATTITATAVHGGRSALCTVMVAATLIEVTSITLNKNLVNLDVGDEETLVATLVPSDATYAVGWSSGNEAVAVVTQGGVVRALSDGIASITAAAGSKSATCIVSVGGVTVVPVEGLTLSKATMSLNVGGNETLTATVTPDNAIQNVDWTSSDEDVAIVSNNGRVVGIAYGVATITVTTVGFSANGQPFTASCTVSVSDVKGEIPVTGVALNTDTLTLIQGNPAILMEFVEPPDANNRGVQWTSDSPQTVSVNNGNLNALAPTPTGQPVTITVMTLEGRFTATCKVTVLPTGTVEVPVEDVTLREGTTIISSLTLEEPGDTGLLTAVVMPGDATNKTVSWFTTDSKVATVNGNSEGSAQVTAVGYGTAVIIVTTVSSGKMAFCSINVPKPSEELIQVTGIELDEYTMSVPDGSSFTLIATVSPPDASNPKVNWESNNTAVASVNSEGVVSTYTVGMAVITATTEDRGYSKVCVVTVYAATVHVSSVDLPASLALKEGESAPLTARLVPGDATNKAVTWISSDPTVAEVEGTGLEVTVKALKKGSTTITVKTGDGNKEAECAVTVDYVYDAPGGMSIGFNKIPDAALTPDSIGTITLYLDDAAAVEVISIVEPGQYSSGSISCTVNGKPIPPKGSAGNFELTPAIFEGLGLGTGQYYLTLVALKGGKWYNTTLDLVLVVTEEEEE